MKIAAWLSSLLEGAQCRHPSREGRKSDTDRVRRIGESLLAVIGPRRGGRGPRRVVLAESRVPNAFCCNDGTIVLNTGLLHALSLSDDELAFVIGHEMAHALRQHGRARLGKNLLIGLATGAARMLLGTRTAHVASLLGHLASQRMSRGDEKEADLLGVRLAADAGFDPKAAMTLLQRASRSETRTPLDWLSSHPLRAERLRYIREALG
jgi:predicted Zn-dependent protease